jgi:hypothetical protein
MDLMITPDMIEFGLAVGVSILGIATRYTHRGDSTHKFTKSYKKKAADVPKILRQ